MVVDGSVRIDPSDGGTCLVWNPDLERFSGFEFGRVVPKFVL